MKNQFKTEVQEILDNWWEEEPYNSKLIINTIVEWLYEDGYWVKENISEFDKQRIKEMANKL